MPYFSQLAQRSHYDYFVENYRGHDFIVISDLNMGGMSVTNNIENIVREVARIRNIDPQKHMVVYRDSQYIYDGYVLSANRFVSLNQKSWTAAARAMIQLL